MTKTNEPGEVRGAKLSVKLVDFSSISPAVMMAATSLPRTVVEPKDWSSTGSGNQSKIYIQPGLCSPLHYCALIGRELNSVATPALLCHEEPVQCTHLGVFFAFRWYFIHYSISIDRWIGGSIKGALSNQ